MYPSVAKVKNNEYRPDPERQTVDKVCSPTWCLHLEVRPKRLSVLFRQLSRSTEDTESTGIPTFCQPMWAFEYLTPKALPLASNWNWVALTLPEPHLCTREVHVTRESNLNGNVDLHWYVVLRSWWKVTCRHWHAFSLILSILSDYLNPTIQSLHIAPDSNNTESAFRQNGFSLRMPKMPLREGGEFVDPVIGVPHNDGILA